MVERWKAFKRSTTWSIWITPQGDPAVEIELLGEWGGMPTKGYVDLVMETPTGDLVVLDKKTGATNPKSNGQLAMYGKDIEKLFGVKVPYGTYFMAREGGLTPPVELAPLVPDLERDFLVAKRIIAQDLFMTSPSNLCGSCGVNHACPFYSPVSTLGASSVPTS
jgi:putative RecB family exonuclease